MRTPFALAALASLLLVGCQSTTHPAPTPTQVKPGVSLTGGLYELTIQGSGTTMAAQVGTPGLRAQAVEPFATPLQFSGPISTSTFTDTQTRTRHVRATFKVTNTTSRTKAVLVFVPVAVRDLDGDATNNAVQPTVRGTPFRSVRLFDGSDASSQAERLVAARGKLFNAVTGATETDTLTTNFLADYSGMSGVDLNTVPFPPVPGVSVEKQNYGWIFGIPAPGESRNVTFAFDIANVDVAQPANDPFAFTMVFETVEDNVPVSAYMRNVVTAAEIYRIESGKDLDTPTSCMDARLSVNAGTPPESVKTCMVQQTPNGTYGYVTTTNNVSYQFSDKTVVPYTPAAFPSSMP